VRAGLKNLKGIPQKGVDQGKTPLKKGMEQTKRGETAKIQKKRGHEEEGRKREESDERWVGCGGTF